LKDEDINLDLEIEKVTVIVEGGGFLLIARVRMQFILFIVLGNF
jgi:hypothetical protein